MDNNNDDDFKVFAKKAHTQILLLSWVVERLSKRQRDGNANIDAIEEDFKLYSDGHGQKTNFRFDVGDDLLSLAQPLLVGGVESIERHSKKEIITDRIERCLGEYNDLKSELDIQVSKLSPLRGEENIRTWTLLKRLRNSLSHFRYEYSDSGYINFRDQRYEEETADFCIGFVRVLDLAYRFGRACVKAEKEIAASCQNDGA